MKFVRVRVTKSPSCLCVLGRRGEPRLWGAIDAILKMARDHLIFKSYRLNISSDFVRQNIGNDVQGNRFAPLNINAGEYILIVFAEKSLVLLLYSE